MAYAEGVKKFIIALDIKSVGTGTGPTRRRPQVGRPRDRDPAKAWANRFLIDDTIDKIAVARARVSGGNSFRYLAKATPALRDSSHPGDHGRWVSHARCAVKGATIRATWAYAFLWSRAGTIYAGSSEIQRNVIADRVLELPRTPGIR